MIKLRSIPLLPFLVVMAITTFSLIVLYSTNGNDFSPWCKNQMWRALLGIAVLVIAMHIRTDIWRKYATGIYLLSLLTLIAVEIIGKISMGAQRWINLGTLTIQPSEMMRVSLTIILAKYFATHSADENKRLKTLITPLMIVFIPIGLVLLQPDLGTAMLLIFTLSAILFVCGVQIWKFLVFFAGIVVSTPILWHFLYEYQKKRILTFLNPEMDPTGAGYHVIQSRIALGSGGFWGRGLMNGTQSQLDFLPEKQTDFIFVAMGEELGFVGCMLLLFLYTLLLIYNYKVAIQTRDKFNRIMVFGITSMIFFYLFINVSMVTGLLPVVGIPLPFFSYGGNALLVLMFCQGLIFAVDCEIKSKHKIQVN